MTPIQALQYFHTGNFNIYILGKLPCGLLLVCLPDSLPIIQKIKESTEKKYLHLVAELHPSWIAGIYLNDKLVSPVTNEYILELCQEFTSKSGYLKSLTLSPTISLSEVKKWSKTLK